MKNIANMSEHKEDHLKFVGWMALEPSKPLVKGEFSRDALGPYDCDVDILNCGICHSDLHLNNGDWGKMSAFPKPQVI